MATIYDVAKHAGVSPKTVSRVLNGNAAVGKATRTAVEAAISDLGYVPSSAARTMRSNRSCLVGLITGAISMSPQRADNSGLPDLFIIQGIQKVLQEADRTVLISDTGGRKDRIPKLIRTFEEHRVEGLIYVAEFHQHVELPSIQRIPHLVIANGYDSERTPCVIPDDRQGQRDLTAEIIAKGHHRIAYLTLSPSLDATRLRVAGYRDALGCANIPFDPDLVLAADLDHSDLEAEFQFLHEAIDRILTLSSPPTVLCMGNDRMALRAYGILRSRGMRIPEDISVAGFDNYQMIAETLHPRLTTAALAYGTIGACAAQMLLDLIQGRKVSVASPHLVRGPVHWRESVIPPESNRSVIPFNQSHKLGGLRS